jgi:hypothetical protein
VADRGDLYSWQRCFCIDVVGDLGKHSSFSGSKRGLSVDFFKNTLVDFSLVGAFFGDQRGVFVE